MYRTHQPLPRGPAPRFSLPLAGLLLCSALVACAGCSSRPLAADAAPPQAAQLVEAPVGDTYTRTVQALTSPDFDTRVRAARSLVQAGDAALPALGRAGELPVFVDRRTQVSATRSVLEAVLAQSDGEQLPAHLESPWPNVRRTAAEELGRRDRWRDIPALIKHLDDADPMVRSASVSSLRRITNNFFGYHATASLGHRRATARRWNAWWTLEGRTRAAERSPSHG